MKVPWAGVLMTLKKKNILHEIKRGWYTFSANSLYVPTVIGMRTPVSRYISKELQGAKYCLWDVN